jgi:agmatine deiminase
LVVAPSDSKSEGARRILARHEIPSDRVDVMTTEIGSPWVRDCAPFVMRDENNLWIASKFYRDTASRHGDTKMSRHFTSQWNLPAIDLPLYLDGGNVIANGDGLLITTTFTLETNRDLGYKRRDVCRLLKEYLGARQIVFLEPLAGEVTKHVDMFLTMPDPETVVLAEYTREQDPINHAILERNLQRLQEVAINGKPLNIVRIPMPPRGLRVFGGTYANVLYANGVLFVPRFGDVDPEGHAQAVEVYQSLLPDWQIQSIEASAWLQGDGSLHCLSKNIYSMPE